MRRSILSFVASSALVLAACTPSEVVVTAEIEVPDPTVGEDATRTMALENVVVELIPFDRDQIFDSLTAAAATPEPEIPPELLAAQEAIAEARTEWQNLEARWSTLRDTLQTLSETLDAMDPSAGRYTALFNEFRTLERQYEQADARRQAAFQRFDSLTQANLEQTQQVRIQRQNWEDEAFADVGEVWDAYLRSSGRKVYADTTTADGIARFTGMKEGDWWVHARYETPNAELYWNVPIQVPGGETVQLRLDRASAEERPKL